MSETMKCPHCHTLVPSGATVCTGCQAEVDYGVPRWLFWFNVFSAILIAAMASLLTTSQLMVVCAGAVWYLGAHLASARAFRDRVVFLRRYSS
jgi:hypothetical protein